MEFEANRESIQIRGFDVQGFMGLRVTRSRPRVAVAISSMT